MAHPGPAHRHRDRRHGTADRLRRRRPSRDHARGRSGDLRGAVRRPPRRPSGHLHEQRDDRCRGRRHRGRRRRARGDRRRTRGRPRRRHERRRRRAPDLGDDRARRRAITRPWRPTCCSCPAAGTRTWRSGRHARGTLRFDERIAAFVPDKPGPQGRIEAVGAAAGEIEGLGEIAPTWVVPPPGPATVDAWATHYVDVGRDATVRDLQRALGAGLESIEHVKRYTTIGTGIEQGRSGGVVASAIAASILGQEVGAVGVPTFRPPTVPVSFAQLAARDRGATLADPVRTTPDPGVARRERRGLRGRRPVEAPALLPARRRVDGRGRRCASAPPPGPAWP